MPEDKIGNLIIVAAPSGGGKTSLVKKLVTLLDEIEVSISHTTRKIRPGEEHGVDYFFIDEQEFLAMVAADDFIEHAVVFKQYYGTSVNQINTRLQAGVDIILDIDWQGAQQIKQLFPAAISIFIIPPSLEALKQRLLNRGQDNKEIIRSRMQRAQNELSHFSEFDYLIVNDNFDKAAYELQTILVANRLRTTRQMCKQRKLLSFLLTSQ